MSLTPKNHQAVPLGLQGGTAANDYAEPSGRYIGDILRRFVQFIDRRDWRDERAKIFDAFITLSFGAGRSVAFVPEQARLRRMTGLGDTVISRAVRDLETQLAILTHWRRKKDAGTHRDRRTGGMMYRIDPDPSNWKVAWRLDAGERKLAIDEWAYVYTLNLRPEAPSLPLPSDVPGLADALRELAREAALAHPLTTTDFPPQHAGTGHASQGPGTPDKKPRLCRQPIIGNEPVAGVPEADTPVTGSPVETGKTSVITSRATPPTTSDQTPLPAHLEPTPENIKTGLAEMRRWLGMEPPNDTPDKVSSPANLAETPGEKLAQTGGAKLAGQLTSLTHAGASDVSEHLHLKHPVSGKAEIYLTSPKHPDVPDECSLHQGNPDVSLQEQPGVYTGDLRADLIRTMGQDSWDQWCTSFWEPALACDRRGIVEVLADYRLTRTRKKIANPGAWMRHVFQVKSRKWKERQR